MLRALRDSFVFIVLQKFGDTTNTTNHDGHEEFLKPNARSRRGLSKL